MESIKYEFGGGDIYTIARDAIAFAKTKQNRGCFPTEVYFIFNELEIHCYASSEPRDIAEKYLLLNELRQIRG